MSGLWWLSPMFAPRSSCQSPRGRHAAESPASAVVSWRSRSRIAASSAYLTVSELFPLEIRAMAIALFYAVGTGAGGLVAPALFGALIQSGSRHELFLGYALAAALMLLGALAALALGVAAERRPLEELARPLSWADD